MKLADYRRRYQELDHQREALTKRLNESDSDASTRIAMERAIKESAGQELTKQQARQLVLAFVERVEGPLNTNSPGASKGRNKLGRAVRVTLRLALADGRQEFIAPIYNPKYTGERVVLDAKDNDSAR